MLYRLDKDFMYTALLRGYLQMVSWGGVDPDAGWVNPMQYANQLTIHYSPLLFQPDTERILSFNANIGYTLFDWYRQLLGYRSPLDEKEDGKDALSGEMWAGLMVR